MDNTKSYQLAKLLFCITLLLLLVSSTFRVFFASELYEVTVLYRGETASQTQAEGSVGESGQAVSKGDSSILKPVNINTAGVEELTRLYRVGSTIAQRIVDYREANGPFETVEELQEVKGIGSSILEANWNIIVLSDQ